MRFHGEPAFFIPRTSEQISGLHVDASRVGDKNDP
jgi:hypothetical protein